MANFLIALAIFLGVWWAWERLKAASARTPRSAARRPSAAAHGGAPFKWPGRGNYEFEVVGESHYQQALAKIAGDHGIDSASAECTAQLVLEDDNQHNRSAVAVLVRGVKVAHMSRDDARSFRRRLGAKGLARWSEHTVRRDCRRWWYPSFWRALALRHQAGPETVRELSRGP